MTPETFLRDRLVLLAGTPAATATDVRNHAPRDVLEMNVKKSSQVGATNCDAAVLCGKAGAALRSRRFIDTFIYIALPWGSGWLAALPGLLRYALRGALKYRGTITLAGFTLPVPVFENKRTGSRKRARVYAPNWPALKIMQMLNDTDCIALRWIESIEDGSHTGDIDILAGSGDLQTIQQRFRTHAGTQAIDLYSSDASGGCVFKDVAYFPPFMARQMLATAVTRPSGIKVANDEWRFVSFCYHLLFHKSEQLAIGAEELTEKSFSRPDYVRELQRLAAAAGQPAPRSITDIENLLKARNVFPEIDTIGFLSTGNRFLQHRYYNKSGDYMPGLTVFLARDFGLEGDITTDIRRQIESAGFSILHERPVDPNTQHAVVHAIRGGNWSDSVAPGGIALPLHAYVAYDAQPLAIKGGDAKRYPRLDNARTLLKKSVREGYAAQAGVRKVNILHASDNTAEAVGYVAALGVGEIPAVKEILTRLRKT
ncbi:MAG: hypothetical protein AB7G06_01660 [Bdellovibrionales bacterium]